MKERGLGKGNEAGIDLVEAEVAAIPLTMNIAVKPPTTLSKAFWQAKEGSGLVSDKVGIIDARALWSMVPGCLQGLTALSYS